jgi:amino acid transporter
MAMPSTDTDELAKFGCKQELDRSLGLFSSFAAGFSYISIMTGVFELFFLGFLSGGPAWIWTWPAVHPGGIRMIFTMGRDNRLPAASAIARVHGRSKTPLIPSLVIGILTIALLVLNVGNQRAFFVLTAVAIIMFYMAYLCVTGPPLIARVRGKWPTPTHGPYFSLGRWGLPVNLLAVIFQVIVLVNLAWPRAQVYGGDHWYYRGAFVFVGILGGVGAVCYLVALRGRPASVLAEHRAGVGPAGVAATSEEA